VSDLDKLRARLRAAKVVDAVVETPVDEEAVNCWSCGGRGKTGKTGVDCPECEGSGVRLGAPKKRGRKPKDPAWDFLDEEVTTERGARRTILRKGTGPVAEVVEIATAEEMESLFSAEADDDEPAKKPPEPGSWFARDTLKTAYKKDTPERPKWCVDCGKRMFFRPPASVDQRRCALCREVRAAKAPP
jgi:hypothetical protein